MDPLDAMQVVISISCKRATRRKSGQAPQLPFGAITTKLGVKSCGKPEEKSTMVLRMALEIRGLIDM